MSTHNVPLHQGRFSCYGRVKWRLVVYFFLALLGTAPLFIGAPTARAQGQTEPTWKCGCSFLLRLNAYGPNITAYTSNDTSTFFSTFALSSQPMALDIIPGEQTTATGEFNGTLLVSGGYGASEGYCLPSGPPLPEFSPPWSSFTDSVRVTLGGSPYLGVGNGTYDTTATVTILSSNIAHSFQCLDSLTGPIVTTPSALLAGATSQWDVSVNLKCGTCTSLDFSAHATSSPFNSSLPATEYCINSQRVAEYNAMACFGLLADSMNITSIGATQVTFNESGLKCAVGGWSVDLDGLSYPVGGNSLSFYAPSGTSYAYTIPKVLACPSGSVSTATVSSATLYGNGSVKGGLYRAYPSSGLIAVADQDIAVNVHFYEEKYSCKVGVGISSEATTTSSTGASLSTCSHIVPLVITGGDIGASQFSDVALGSDGEGSYIISFNVTGTSGTTGTSILSVPKSDVPSGLSPVVYINGDKAATQSFTQDGNYYNVTFSTHFSTDSVDITFLQSATPSPGPVPEFPYQSIAVAALIVVVSVSYLLVRRRP